MKKDKLSDKNIRTILLEKTLRLSAPAFFLIMTFGIYFPSVLFLGNINEFALSYWKVIPYILAVSLVALVLVYIIGLLCVHAKVFQAYLALVFSIALGFYLQGNFFDFGLTSLNGNKIDWSKQRTGMIISIIVWLLCLIVPMIFMFYKQKIAERIMKYGSLLLTAMQLVSLIVAVLTTSRNVENNFAVTKKDEFQLSSNQNIIMFVVDTLDASWFEDTILQDDQDSAQLRDFTYYSNAVAGGAPTAIGIPTLLTGIQYSNTAMSVNDYYKDAYGNSSVFKDLSQHNYLVKLYTDYALLNHSDKQYIDNVETGCEYKVAWKSEFVKYLYRFTSFYAMPMPLKQSFWFYSDDFSSLVAIDDDTDTYKFNDPLFYQEYQNSGITTQNEKNAFVMYHLTGAHGPYTMDENACRSDSETTMKQQVFGSFKIITEYMNELKEKGLYDNSTIIITADHGGVGLYQNPAILVKEQGAKKDHITTDDAPVTFKNLTSTYMAAALNQSGSNKVLKSVNEDVYGKTLTEISEETKEQQSQGGSADDVVRYHAAPDSLAVQLNPDLDFVAKQKWTLYRIKGNARDLSNMEPLESGDYDLSNH